MTRHLPLPALRRQRTAFIAATPPHGFTLIELMVALALSLLIVLAACAALLSAQRGYAGVDASSQLRDNARFAVELIQRLALQTGYQDLTSNTITREEVVLTNPSANPDPDVIGYNNAVVDTSTFTTTPSLSNGSRGSACGTSTDTSCANGSDVLVLRFYGINELTPGAATGDGSVIDCTGNKVPPLLNNNIANRGYSIFYVDVSTGEPTLMCATNTTGGWTKQPLVAGVESFQVLYGVDNVTAGSPGIVNTPATGTPTQWLRADQIGNNNAAWRRVRRIRIGLLLRGPANSAVDPASTAATYYPLGYGSTANNGSIGMGDATNDPGTALVVATADGRIRRTMSFTVYLRNPLNVN